MPKIPALPFARGGVSAGLSANEAFRQYQAAARTATEQTGEEYTAGRRDVFLQMYASTLAARNRIGDAMQAPKDIPAGGLDIVQRPSVRATGYGNWSVIFSRPIGSSDLETLFYYQRSDEPLTPEEVEARAREDFEASATDVHGSQYRNTIEGIMFTGTELLIPTSGA